MPGINQQIFSIPLPPISPVNSAPSSPIQSFNQTHVLPCSSQSSISLPSFSMLIASLSGHSPKKKAFSAADKTDVVVTEPVTTDAVVYDYGSKEWYDIVCNVNFRSSRGLFFDTHLSFNESVVQAAIELGHITGPFPEKNEQVRQKLLFIAGKMISNHIVGVSEQGILSSAKKIIPGFD
ncbi:hypothetical protein SC171_21975 [Pantoea cypripedii]|uniref:hypothetical protein n=1 Tax=Pantoea cypripedii TaxID=55209 RepID=UPI002FCC5EA4